KLIVISARPFRAKGSPRTATKHRAPTRAVRRPLGQQLEPERNSNGFETEGCPSACQQRLTGRGREYRDHARGRCVVRRDGVYLRISFPCRSDASNILAHFIVILADQSTKRPRLFRRALHLPDEVTHQGVASS